MELGLSWYNSNNESIW